MDILGRIFFIFSRREHKRTHVRTREWNRKEESDSTLALLRNPTTNKDTNVQIITSIFQSAMVREVERVYIYIYIYVCIPYLLVHPGSLKVIGIDRPGGWIRVQSTTSSGQVVRQVTYEISLCALSEATPPKPPQPANVVLEPQQEYHLSIPRVSE